jgi:hypothetical protein
LVVRYTNSSRVYSLSESGVFSEINSKNLAVAVMFLASLVGAIFRNNRVQAAVALTVAATWIWYFSKLQEALS